MIRASSLSKRYTIYPRSLDRLRDWMLPGPKRGQPFWALRDITLEVPRGSSLGIVGVNGAGKSTLLKILTGTTVPTEGTFEIDGRVSALLELGMGFHPEFTGRENIAFNAKLYGLGAEELRAKTPEIIDFAEIASFIDQPIRTYSSGMIMRLAFAVASSVDPDVLIIDEALAVGDLHFQQKCLARIRRFHEAGITVLFVSHDPALIKNFCNEAILLDGGRLIDRGRPDEVLDHYNALLAEKYRDSGSQAVLLRPDARSASVRQNRREGSASSNPTPASTISHVQTFTPSHAASGHRVGNFRAAITSVQIRSLGINGNASILTPGMKASIVVRAVALESIEDPTVGILIKDRLGNEIFGTNTYLRGHSLGTIEPGQAIEVAFTTPLNLGEGLYSITVALHSGPTHTEVCYDWIERAATFQILPTPTDRFTGACRLEVQIEHALAPAHADEVGAISELKAV
jgi:lipopolysaccharide transport system ATP-binding protein